MSREVNHIHARLALRKPQRESLEILAELLGRLELGKGAALERALAAVREAYPAVTEFEREFPSLCFALATGVGKTRLMGAFIAWLYLTGRSRNFLVLAPNLTIYDKLIADFSPRSPKYVFRGLPEFAGNGAPVVVTGDTWDRAGSVRGRDLFNFDARPYVNVFNISKLNATDNRAGAAKSRTPRVKRLQETLGESYFAYLSGPSTTWWC